MEDTFLIRGRSCQVFFKSKGLEWTVATSNKRKFISTVEIVSVWLCPRGDPRCGPSATDHAAGEATLTTSHNSKLRTSASNPVESTTAAAAVPPSTDLASTAAKETYLSEEVDVGVTPPRNINYKTFSYEENLTQLEAGTPPRAWPCHHQSGHHGATLCVEYCERVLPNGVCCRPEAGQEHIIGEWRTQRALLCHESADIVKDWYNKIWDAIRDLQDRPRHLVVIINPVGGKRDGGSIYRRLVAPLFARAAIATTVLETTPEAVGTPQAREAASTPGVDGLVMVGGDGSLSQVLKGLLEQSAGESNVDINDSRTNLPQTKIRVGMIPTGTTNCTTKCLNGSDDRVTAALHIIMGDCRCLDVIGIYDQSDHLVTYTTNCVSLGFLGANAKMIQSLRSRGVPLAARIALSGLTSVCRARSYSTSIKACTPVNCLTSPLDAQICTSSCAVCSSREGSCSKDGGSTWVEINGDYYGVFALLVSSRGSFSSHGLSPAAHLGDGCMDLLLIPNRAAAKTALSVGRALLTRDHLSRGMQNNDVTVLRCSEAILTSPEEVPWALDGEAMSSASYRIKVHRQRLQMFGRGLEMYSTQP